VKDASHGGGTGPANTGNLSENADWQLPDNPPELVYYAEFVDSSKLMS
jgi:hypothetical protein